MRRTPSRLRERASHGLLDLLAEQSLAEWWEQNPNYNGFNRMREDKLKKLK